MFGKHSAFIFSINRLGISVTRSCSTFILLKFEYLIGNRTWYYNCLVYRLCHVSYYVRHWTKECRCGVQAAQNIFHNGYSILLYRNRSSTENTPYESFVRLNTAISSTCKQCKQM